MNPVLAVLALAVVGAGLLIAGTLMLAGPGWALVAGGVASIVGAALLRRGLKTGG